MLKLSDKLAQSGEPEGGATFTSPLGPESAESGVSASDVKAGVEALGADVVKTTGTGRVRRVINPATRKPVDGVAPAGSGEAGFDDTERSAVVASIIKATSVDAAPDRESLKALREEGVEVGLFTVRQEKRGKRTVTIYGATDQAASDALAAIQQAERELTIADDVIKAEKALSKEAGGSTVKRVVRRVRRPKTASSTTTAEPKVGSFEDYLKRHGAPDADTKKVDPALHESAREALDLLGLGSSGDGKDVGEKGQSLHRVGLEQARDLARVEAPMRDEARRLRQDAAAVEVTGKKRLPAELRALADEQQREAEQMASRVLNAQEAKAEELGARVVDINEARYLAEREDPLQSAAIEARDKLGRIQVAERLVERAKETGKEARKDYEKVSRFLASEMEIVTNMLAAGEGQHKVGSYVDTTTGGGGERNLLKEIRAEDQLSAAAELKKVLECQAEPVHQQITDGGHTIELVYQSDRPGSQKLLFVERWDKVTGKLISLNTVVYRGEPRKSAVDKLRPWRDPEIRLSDSIESKLAQLRAQDDIWRLQPGNNVRNESALMANMAAMGTYPDVRERYNPVKKPAAKRQGWMVNWFKKRASKRATKPKRS